MKLTIFGSTGLTGRELVKQALAKGYTVSTLVRHQLNLNHPRLMESKGDIFNPEAVKRVIEGSQAVISVLGSMPALLGSKSTAIYSDSAAVFVAPMKELALERLIFCTSAGVEKIQVKSGFINTFSSLSYSRKTTMTCG